MTLKFIELCAGIGGFGLGFERAGMKCVAQVEYSPSCQIILKKHWPDVPKFWDVKHVGSKNLPTADLICSGFPCQPHSLAGARKGEDDDRNLWPEIFRIIKECRPAWFVGENVVGIVTTMLDKIKSDLESLSYTVEFFDLPASGFNADHHRRRIFILAHDNSERGKGFTQEQIQRITTIQRVENVRGVTPIIQRSDYDSPVLCGSGDGVSRRVDRLRMIGNAVNPQVVEFIGRHICLIQSNID